MLVCITDGYKVYYVFHFESLPAKWYARDLDMFCFTMLSTRVCRTRMINVDANAYFCCCCCYLIKYDVVGSWNMLLLLL